MRSDVHAAALRSAAKLVLGMASFASLTGCSSEATDDTGTSTNAVVEKNDATSDLSEMIEPGTTGKETTPECKATLATAFPEPGHYGQTSAQPADVIGCCQQELQKHGSMTAYRWECCFAYDETAKVDPGPDGDIDPWDAPTLQGQAPGFACTPWGPPVPPSMNRTRKMSPARRDMNRFLAAQVA